MIIFGRRLFGRTDYVTLGSERKPGYHVATLFCHVQFIPLIPLSSHLCLEFVGGESRAVSLPVDGKSVVMAWLRCASWWAALLLGAFSFLGNDGFSWKLFLCFIAAMGFACIVTWHKYFNDASYERANELLVQINGGDRFHAAMKRMIDASYVSQSLKNASLEDLVLVVPAKDAGLEEGGAPEANMPDYPDVELSAAVAVPVGSNDSSQNEPKVGDVKGKSEEHLTVV